MNKIQNITRNLAIMVDEISHIINGGDRRYLQLCRCTNTKFLSNAMSGLKSQRHKRGLADHERKKAGTEI